MSYQFLLSYAGGAHYNTHKRPHYHILHNPYPNPHLILPSLPIITLADKNPYHFTLNLTHTHWFLLFCSIFNTHHSPMELTATRFHYCSLLALFLGFEIASSIGIGINYGQIANNLPPPENVVPLVKSVGATQVKLYDADPRVLRAFGNSGVEFTVGLGNENLNRMNDPSNAMEWVKSNVQAYLPATKITCVTVGNEVLTLNDTSLSSSLLPAMESIHSALSSLGLANQISVTTAHSLAILESSYPPSSGVFRRDLAGSVSRILDFHSRTGSAFLINAYPYFAYKASPKHIEIEYVLFQPNQGVVDPETGLHYDNMLFAQIDAVYSAMTRSGFKTVPLRISETGWPSKGDGDEAGATAENAKRYNGNLIKILNQKKGTPMRPACRLNIYVFALFNENLKPGPASERNYGLFKPDGTPAYSLGVGTSSSSSNKTSPGGSVMPLSPPGGDSEGYLSISAAAAAAEGGGFVLLGSLLLCFKLLL